MPYVDGYLLPLPKKNLAAYTRMARVAAKVWRELGALAYHETVGDDMKSEWARTFPQQMKLKPNETVVLAYVMFKSKAHRNRVNAAVMKDPRMNAMMEKQAMPFDVKRMVYGGFKTIVAL